MRFSEFVVTYLSAKHRGCADGAIAKPDFDKNQASTASQQVLCATTPIVPRRTGEGFFFVITSTTSQIQGMESTVLLPAMRS